MWSNWLVNHGKAIRKMTFRPARRAWPPFDPLRLNDLYRTVTSIGVDRTGLMRPMELYHNQVMREQGVFSLRMFHRSWGIMMIQENILGPCTVLDFPRSNTTSWGSPRSL